jgi:hypothetical protein
MINGKVCTEVRCVSLIMELGLPKHSFICADLVLLHGIPTGKFSSLSLDCLTSMTQDVWYIKTLVRELKKY